MQLRRAAVPVLALVLAAAVAPASAAERHPDRAERRAPTTVTFTGTGWGHGHGLSQYGARNRAAKGQGYAAIVRHYYPGTSLRTIGGKIRIRLDSDTNRDVVVLPTKGLAVQAIGGRTWRLPVKAHGKKVTRWRILPSGGRAKVQQRVGSWHTWRTIKGEAQFKGGRPMTLVTPHGRATYHGTLRATHGRTVNTVSLETYLRGVVPQEVPAEWPANAVRAQAVAARTYAAFERRDHRAKRDYYDLCDTSSCQVYGGAGVVHPKSDAAVRATARKVLTYGGNPIFAQFSASNGGYSVAGGYPYLRAARDTFDRGVPGDPWTKRVKAAAITRNWPGMGDLVSIEVTDRDGTKAHPGHARELTVTGTNFSQTVSATTLQSWLGMRSTMFTVNAS